jgi:hypothetical protein
MNMTTTNKIVSVDTHMDTVCTHLEKIKAPEIIMKHIVAIKDFITRKAEHPDRDTCLEMRDKAMRLKSYMSIIDAPHEVRKSMDGVYFFLVSVTPEAQDNRVSGFMRSETA